MLSQAHPPVLGVLGRGPDASAVPMTPLRPGQVSRSRARPVREEDTGVSGSPVCWAARRRSGNVCELRRLHSSPPGPSCPRGWTASSHFSGPANVHPDLVGDKSLFSHLLHS